MAIPASPRKLHGDYARVNSQLLNPGDRVLLARGGRFGGSVRPMGSGTAEAPITLGAYGSGALPVIDARGQEESVRLLIKSTG